MIKPRLIAVLMVCVLLPLSALKAQDADVLAREGDEIAITTEDRQRTLTILLTAARQARDAGEWSKAARYMNRVGRLQLRLNLPQEALATYRDALSILKQAPDTSIKVDSLNGSGAVYIILSKCDEAETVLRQAIALSEQSGYVAGKADALLTLSNCQNYGDHALALRTAQEALTLLQSVNRKLGIARAYTLIGHYQLALNNLIEAAQSNEAALSLWRELSLSDRQAEALINLGFIEYRKGAWQNSLSFLTQAQGLLDGKSDPYKMGQITAGMAEAFIESGSPEIGLGKLQQALEYFRQTQHPLSQIIISWDIGRTYYLLGDYTKALATLQKTLTDAEAIKAVATAAMCNEFLGRTFAATGDRTAALQHFHTALDLYLKVNDTMEAARTSALIGRVYEQEGKVETAREYYQKALGTFSTLTDRVNQSATLYALGSLELKQNNLNAAENHLRQSIEVTENIRRVSTSIDLTAAFSAAIYERYEKYIACLMRKHAAQPAGGFSVQAFEASDLARARSLTELLRATQTNLLPGLDQKLAEEEKSLRQSLRVKEDYKVALLGRTYKKEELDALEADLKRLEAKYKEVTEAIQARYPSYEQLTQPASWNLRQIQEQVIADDQTVLLEYSLGTDKSYVWAVTRDSITSYELPSQALVNEAVQKVYKLLAIPPGIDPEDQLTAAAQELGRMILSPVAAQLNKRRIIVVADGALNYIPFQILPSPVANDEPLIASYEVVNAPSASILGALRREATHRQPAKLLAAFGDPVFASNYAQRKDANGSEQLVAMQTLESEQWRRALRDIELNGDSFDPSVIKPLFYARRELSNLRDVAVGEETFVAADFTATRAELLGADLTQYAILHFATHGLLDPKRPENSGLILSTVNREGQAQNGFVGLQDIYALRAPVELVVLSACQTALGKDVRGEGLLGLTRGFMYAGASSVVASLWKVDDEATAELMRQFYTNMLQTGMSPAAALRAAQNSIRQKPEWRSPYYWAAFTLQGEYQQVIKPTPAVDATAFYWKAMVGGAFLLLLASVAFWYRRYRVRATQESR
jgi:CHAT domain-containing protein/tetratricopeptide (TPR) repeat protein